MKSEVSCSPAHVQRPKTNVCFTASLFNSRAEYLIWLYATSLRSRPWWRAVSFIPHSIALPWVASVIAAPFGLPFGETVTPGLSFLPGVRSLSARLQQATVKRVSMMNLLRAQPLGSARSVSFRAALVHNEHTGLWSGSG